jgi:hypothetical protein
MYVGDARLSLLRCCLAGRDAPKIAAHRNLRTESKRRGLAKDKIRT